MLKTNSSANIPPPRPEVCSSRKRERERRPPSPSAKRRRRQLPGKTSSSNLTDLRRLVSAAATWRHRDVDTAADRLRDALRQPGCPSLDGLLHEAVRAGPGPALALLLRRGADPEAADADGRTPLMSAAEAGNADGLVQLLEAGARTEARDVRGRTALHWALLAGCEAAAMALLRRGADFSDAAATGRERWFEPLRRSWLRELGRPLRLQMQRLQAACFHPAGRYRLCDALTPLLATVGPVPADGHHGRRVFVRRFRSPQQQRQTQSGAGAGAHLLLVTIAHFDGRGGVFVRPAAGPLFARPPELNGRGLRPLLSGPAAARDLLFTLEPLEPPGERNRLELNLLPDCPAGVRLLLGGFAFANAE